MPLSKVLILPGSLDFELAIQDLPPPPGWQQEAAKRGGEIALIGTVGGFGMMEAVPISRFHEYVYDGELDERQEEIDAHHEAIESAQSRLILPVGYAVD